MYFMAFKYTGKYLIWLIYHIIDANISEAIYSYKTLASWTNIVSFQSILDLLHMFIASVISVVSYNEFVLKR